MLYVRAVDGDGFPDLMVVDANGNLRSNAPAPATITQIVSAGDATGDGKTDLVYRTDVSAGSCCAPASRTRRRAG